jgi:hypothetical protein
MPSRFAKQKPDPAIKRNVLRARANLQDTKGERAMVAIASIGATISAWALFATLGSPAAPATQVAGSSQPALTISAQATNASGSSTSGGLLPVLPSTSQLASASGAAAIQSTTTSQAAGAGISTQAPQAVAVTRSSR